MNENLIIDAGMHVGQDTAYYLDKGFDVVAVEANPVLARAAEERFAGAIAAGRLRVLNVAVAERTGTASLSVSDDATIWSSLDADFVRRNEAFGTRYRTVDVPAVRFDELLADVGIPYYLKIDIEGLDMLCVRALHRFDDRPAYVSLESKVSVGGASYADAFDELAHLWALGYRRFKYVDQRRHPEIRLAPPAREGGYVDQRFSEDSSGPFGEETPGVWRPFPVAVARGAALWSQHDLAGFGGRREHSRPAATYRRAHTRLTGRALGWYDLHAAL
ncbi:FkbM family methyltransferase [Solirubrobacter sp. CPCC 204708]|uniref:FkbM family methyltransferase n=1 Tax=Solirubrobacter deserti TaxID=2282478 RepID=A0ABT4RM60_9ACTN|nr:FkbM family methyltransferase [Solirubrobacter deserti]MBE2317974.1 FkbM family methyltransferase [Solirubrobacter deserti]MDA0139653.1 FkbM family methyltransferase [Solirubrobacter deserti]